MATSEVDRVLGRRVARARQERGLSQRALAEKAGIGRDAVRRMEGAKSSAQKTTIMAVARALGLSYENLVPEDGDFAPSSLMSLLTDAPSSLPEPGAPVREAETGPHIPVRRSAKRAVDGYIPSIYVADRSWEEVVEEMREWYELIQAARARTNPAEGLEPEHFEQEDHD